MAFLSAIFAAILAFFGMGPATNQTASSPTEISVAANTQATTAEQSIRTDQATTSIKNESKDIDTSPTTKISTPTIVPSDLQTMLVAGGCFWCTESDIENISGVTRVLSGYAGGTTRNPTYANYGEGGHREVVEIAYDSNKVSFEQILIVALKTTDPTDDNGTFGDRGDKYSAAFYYTSPTEKTIIESLIKEVDDKGPYDKPLAIDVEATPTFWPAEDYHQDYYKGTLTQLKYKYYRTASGRDAFISKYWGTDTSSKLPWRS